jgi:hypothetical protein
MIRRIADVAVVVCSVIGACLVAANIGAALYGYIIFIIANVASLVVLSKAQGVKSVMLVNAMFFVINLVGIVRNI